MEHLSDTEIESYRSRTASPEQMLAINDHIFECDQCFRLFDSPEKVRRVYDAITKYLQAEPPWRHDHLDYDQLEGYVDGTLDAAGRETVSAHMEVCSECNSEVQELNELKAQIQSETDGSRRRFADRRQLAILWRNPGYRLASGFAFLVVILSCIFWIQAKSMRLRVAGLESTIARFEQENSKLKLQVEKLGANLPGRTSLALRDGNRQITVDEKGELRGLDMLPAVYRGALKDALTTGRIAMPSPPETSTGQTGSLLGIEPQSKGFEALSPVGTAVEDTRAVFRWQRLAGATSYTVLLRDLATGEESEGQPTAETTWTSDKELIRGHQYAWMVEAMVDGRNIRAPAPDKPFASFRILDEQQAGEISLARQTWGNSHVVMGVIYAKSGLVHEAEKEFRELVAANPESSVARNLLSSVQGKAASRGRQR